MRAWALCQALGQCGEVSTIVVPVSGPRAAPDSGWQTTAPVDSISAVTSWVRYATGRRWLGQAGLPVRARAVSPGIADQVARLTQSANASLHEFDAIVCLRVYMAGVLVAAIESRRSGAKKPLLVLDADEAEHRLLQQRAAHHASAGQPMLAERYGKEAQCSASFCAAVLPDFDLVTASSQIEAQHLSPLAVSTPVRVLPNVFHAPTTSTTRKSFRTDQAQSQPRFVFVGNLDYWPNSDAVAWLLEQVWPAVRKVLPGAQLRIIGTGARHLASRHAGQHGVKWLGWVDDLATEYRSATACLAPLRAGAGTRLKVLEAFALGTPVVGTRLGLEGLGIAHGKQALLAENPASFAKELQKLVENTPLQQEISARALAHLQRHFLPERFNARLHQLIDDHLAN